MRRICKYVAQLIPACFINIILWHSNTKQGYFNNLKQSIYNVGKDVRIPKRNGKKRKQGKLIPVQVTAKSHTAYIGNPEPIFHTSLSGKVLNNSVLYLKLKSVLNTHIDKP